MTGCLCVYYVCVCRDIWISETERDWEDIVQLNSGPWSAMPFINPVSYKIHLYFTHLLCSRHLEDIVVAACFTVSGSVLLGIQSRWLWHQGVAFASCVLCFVRFRLLKHLVKAAIFNTSMLTMDQMAIWHVKGVASSEGPLEKDYPTLQFPSAL